MKKNLLSVLIASTVMLSLQALAFPAPDAEPVAAAKLTQSTETTEKKADTPAKPLLLTSKEGFEKSNAIRTAIREKNQAAAKAMTGPRLWYAGFGLEGSSKAFAGDVKLAAERLKALYPGMISYIAYNDQTVEQMEVPLATLTAIENTTFEIGKQANPQDLAVIMISSHGNEHILGVKLDGEYSGPITDNYLEINLRKLKALPTLIIISACHSGSMIPVLKAENRIILAAAAADKVSYGCQPLSENTFFIDALMGKAPDPTLSLNQLFVKLKEDIAAREKKEKLEPSEPQMFIGEKMKKFADLPVSDWLKPSS